MLFLDNHWLEMLGKMRNSGGLCVRYPFEQVLLAFKKKKKINFKTLTSI